MEKYSYGQTKDGREGTVYVLENKNGMKVEITDFGATVCKIEVPDQDGNLIDVVLGYDEVQGYEEGTVFFGSTVGRSANRIGGGTFRLHEVEYVLDQNNGGNNLHSGMAFYHLRFWEVKEVSDTEIICNLESPDGDQGYPGNVTLSVTFTLTEDNELKIAYAGIPDQDTILNLTNHSYFNLDGHASGSVLEQEIWLDADAFTRADADSIPTGEIVSVEGTPMDWRKAKKIGAEIEEDYEALILGGGYDHNWVLKTEGTFQLVGSLSSQVSGLKMEVYTDMPGIQIYTGNFLDHENGKNGIIYEKRSGVCFETQYFPDGIHHENFPSPVVKAGEKYETTTSYKFVVM